MYVLLALTSVDVQWFFCILMNFILELNTFQKQLYLSLSLSSESILLGLAIIIRAIGLEI